MRFEVLGPVRVVRGGQVAGPISDLRRKLLAVLLVRAGRPVPSEVLGEALWGEAVPQRPANSMQVHVYRLRQVLDSPDRLVSASGGYQLNVDPGELDADVFGQLHGAARRTAQSGDLDQAVGCFREALALWRGAPYADIDETEVVAPAAQRLAETRLIAYEELFDAELARGRAREIVPELTELVAEYPLRERLIGQQMLALYRSGRRTRAEVAYRAARQRLARELRAEPGRELRDLGEAIQNEDPKLDQVAAAAGQTPTTQTSGRTAEQRSGQTSGQGPAVRPSQLPPPPGAFFGREGELEQLDGADGLVLLTGMAGIGKTGLALQYAHQVADRFGDGQLYIDLGGHATGPAVDPLTALGQLLRGLGADTKRAWESVADATAEYRSVLNGRKVLVLLDNAASAEQIRPLLPATSGCLTVVTSRNKLSGLIAREGAHRIGVGELPSDAAHALLTRLVGTDRLAAESVQSTALIKACAGLPLALRIAAAQLADEPHRPLADYLAELDEHGAAALTLQDDEHSAVSAAFDLSYQRLDPATRQLFRRLGLVPGLDFTIEAIAALSGMTPFAARGAVRRLTAAHLLEEHSPGRYRFHDLLRDDTHRRAATEDSAETRDDALERLYAWYYQGKMAAAAASALTSTLRHPPAPRIPEAIGRFTFDDARSAIGWMKAEFANVAAAVSAAATHPEHAHWTWQLAVGLMHPMAERGYILDIHTMANSGIAAARAAGDRHALANMLAELCSVRHRFDLPLDTALLDEAVRHAEQVENSPLLGYCLNVSAIVYLARAEFDLAEQYLVRALEIRDIDKRARARSLGNLGLIATGRGDLRRAEQWFGQIVGLADRDDDRMTAMALPELIRVRTMLGQLDGIGELIERADSAVTRSGDRTNAHKLRICRVIWYRDTGRHREAFDQATAALRSAQDVGQLWTRSNAHYHLGMSQLARGELDHAREEFERAAESAELGNVLQGRSPAARGLAETELAAGRPDVARAHAAKAVDLGRSGGRDPVQLAGAIVTLGRVELALGRAEEAVGRGEEALGIHERTEHFLGRARAHRLLGEARRDDEVRREHLRQALTRFEAYGSPEAIPVRQLLGL